MNAARFAATAVSVAGKFLVTGGIGDPNAADSWEMYDPATDTWTAGRLNTAHAYHTMTLLRDNSILITGGASTDPICELGIVAR